MAAATDRFSLLLLEPGEIYFQDAQVTLIHDETKPPNADGNSARGWLKICSKSIVFCPQTDPNQMNKPPLFKFPLSDVSDLTGTL